MNLVDVVIKNGLVATSSGVIQAGIAIENGKIVSIANSSMLPRADLVINARGKIVLPGLIDGHCHFWNSEDPSRENFETGTRAAAAGGVTTVLEHPTTWIPQVLDTRIFNEKKRLVSKKSVVDFGLHGGVSSKTIHNVVDLLRKGALGIKMFMCSINTEMMLYDGEMLAALVEIEKGAGIGLIHAENDFMISYNEKLLKAKGRRDHLALQEWRPPVAEFEAIRRAVLLVDFAKSKAIICHVSIPEGVEEVTQAKKMGSKVYVETCPHYLYLSTKDLRRKGPWVSCVPPIRDKCMTVQMWSFLQNGLIDIIASDHVPYEETDKKRGADDLWRTQMGMPGIETLLPLMLTGVSLGRISLERLVSVTSENPAKIYGIYPKKGALRIGADADLVVIDINRDKKIRGTELQTVCKWSPFEGFKVIGVPMLTLVRGNVVMEEGEVVGKAGSGQFVQRQRQVPSSACLLRST